MLTRFNAYKLGWLRDALWLILMVTVIFVLFRFIIGISVVEGNSMEPVLKDGNVVIYLRPVNNYREGDIVSVRIPSGEYYVKRVAASAGAKVEIYDGQLYVDGDPKEDRFAHGKTEREAGAVMYPYEVREGNYFLLGDNREASMDSRYFGEVSRRQIRGRVIFAFTDDGLKTPEYLSYKE